MSSVVLSNQECLVCGRVGTEQFYRELRLLGFQHWAAIRVLKLLAQIYFKEHTLFAGIKRNTIKAALTYLVYSIYWPLRENQDKNPFVSISEMESFVENIKRNNKTVYLRDRYNTRTGPYSQDVICVYFGVRPLSIRSLIKKIISNQEEVRQCLFGTS